MKREDINALLTGAGLTDEEAIKKVSDSIFAEYGKEIQQKDATISTLNGQLSEANGKLEGYDPEWKAKAETARQALEAQQYEFAVEKAVTAAKPRNAKAVMALLDRDKLKFAGGEVIGLDGQLKALREGEDTAFLFRQDEQPQSPKRTGMSHQGGRDVGGGDKRQEANDALRAAFGHR